MKLPNHIVLCRDEIERLMKKTLENMEEKNKMIRGLKILSRRVKLIRRASKKRRLRFTKVRQVVTHCENLAGEHIEKWWRKEIHEEELDEEYEDKICAYLQEQLNVSVDPRNRNERYKKFAAVIFYYLMRDGEPNKHVQKLVHILYTPLFNHSVSDENYSWYEFCCVVDLNTFRNENTFDQFYTLIDHNKTTLEYLLYKKPQLLLNRKSADLINTLIEHLSYETLHHIITNIRDWNGQTHMFYIDWDTPYVKLYIKHIHDLYDLLSIRNTNGQTALHVNTRSITYLLAELYTPKYQIELINLAFIPDEHNNHAIQHAAHDDGRDELCHLISQAENNQYATDSWFDANIIIIYNTKKRSGAEEEAQTIYEACQWINKRVFVTIERDLTKNKTMDLIKETARKMKDDYPFKSMITILMSHGSIGTIDDYNGDTIGLSNIEEAMCSDILDGRPKMLITQCCQRSTGEVDKDLVAYAPTHPDFCAVMSCVYGEKAKRGVLIETLAGQLEKHRWNRGMNIFKLVNNISSEMERD